MVRMMKKLAADRNSLDPPPIKALRLVHLPVYNRYRYQPCIISLSTLHHHQDLLLLLHRDVETDFLSFFVHKQYLFWTLLLRKNLWLDPGSYCPLLLQIHDPQGALVPSLVPQCSLVSNLARSVLGVRCPHPNHIFVIFVRQPHLKTWKLYVAPRVCKFTTKFSCDKNLYNLISDLFTHSSPFCGSLVTFFACLKKVCQHHGWRK